MAKVCRDANLEDGDRPQWTRKVIDQFWNQLMEDVEARNVIIKNIMWKSTDFLRHTFTFVCELGKLFLVEDFLCCLSTNHGERRKHKRYGWLVAWCVRATV